PRHQRHLGLREAGRNRGEAVGPAAEAMKKLETSIDIDGAPAEVWSVLADVARYPEWNPFLRELSGALAVGARLRVRIEPPGGRAMTFRPTVRKAEPGRALVWLGHLIVPGLFDGEHS